MLLSLCSATSAIIVCKASLQSAIVLTDLAKLQLRQLTVSFFWKIVRSRLSVCISATARYVFLDSAVMPHRLPFMKLCFRVCVSPLGFLKQLPFTAWVCNVLAPGDTACMYVSTSVYLSGWLPVCLPACLSVSLSCLIITTHAFQVLKVLRPRGLRACNVRPLFG